MKISIIGTNGLLAGEIASFCNKGNIKIDAYGRREPSRYFFEEFNQVDLMNDKINIDKISKNDLIIYASGAGIQSNKNDTVESIYNLNAYIPINICNELNQAEFKGTFITFGSYFEIGNNSDSILFTENDVINSMLGQQSNYGISKRLLTKYAASAHLSFKYLHLILPTIYGENEAPHRLIPYTVAALKKKMPVQYTNGEQLRQYLYAGDVPNIIYRLLSLDAEGIYNLSGVETYSIRNIVELIHQFYNTDLSNQVFGEANRTDVIMKNLQLDGKILKSIMPDFKYTKFLDTLKLYDKCF
jgi:nucleoside-diphosphate-sugar epimerase